jgi:RNA polymerase sigma factor (sigma-70 family)
MKLENEDKILEMACAGDADAIVILIKHYQPDLKKFASEVCQSTEDAEDAVQHTLAVISTKISMFKKTAKLSSWLFTIVKNECLKFLRKQKRFTEIDDTILDPSIGVEDKLTEAQQLAKIQMAISSLEPIYRDVFILRDIEGRSAHDVSINLGISIASVKSRLHRARNDVRITCDN